MSDQPQEEPAEIPSLDDRIKREVALVFARNDLVDKEGKQDQYLIANLIQPTIEAALVVKPGDRAKVGVTPNKLMEVYFPDVTGPAEWANYEGDERKFHEGVYTKVKSEVFRVLSTQPTGIIQQKLANGNNGGLVLCRTPATKGREEMAYVTRNYVCVREDLTTPETNRAKRSMDRAAAIAQLAMQRIPEKAGQFAREYKTEIKLALASGENRIQGTLDAQTNGADADASDTSE